MFHGAGKGRRPAAFKLVEIRVDWWKKPKKE